MLVSVVYIIITYIIAMVVGFIMFDFIEYLISKYNSIKEESEQKQKNFITEIINDNINKLLKKIEFVEDSLNKLLINYNSDE